MKIFIVALAFFACTAHADSEVNLENKGLLLQNPSIDPSFAADKDLGRAWVVLSITEGPGAAPGISEEDKLSELVNVKVNGLAFDPETGNITYEKNNEKIICARQGRVLGARHFKNSNNCKIRVSKVTRKTDDGFRLRNEHVVDVVIDTPNRY